MKHLKAAYCLSEFDPREDDHPAQPCTPLPVLKKPNLRLIASAAETAPPTNLAHSGDPLDPGNPPGSADGIEKTEDRFDITGFAEPEEVSDLQIAWPQEPQQCNEQAVVLPEASQACDVVCETLKEAVDQFTPSEQDDPSAFDDAVPLPLKDDFAEKTEGNLQTIEEGFQIQVEELKSRMINAVAEACRQIARVQIDQRIDAEISSIVRDLCNEGAQIIVAAPENILERLKARLSDCDFDMKWQPHAEPEVRVICNETIIETRIADWLDQLGASAG